jgi:hypothetical protein
MRTTITVDPDVEQLLRAAMQATGQSLKATLNEAVRRGLSGIAVQASEPRFKVKPRPMGLRAGIDPARVGDLADDLEVEAFLDVSRSLKGTADKR